MIFVAVGVASTFVLGCSSGRRNMTLLEVIALLMLILAIVQFVVEIFRKKK